MPMLNETDFQLRLEAAVALRKEREGREERSGLDHLGKSAKSSGKTQLKKELKKGQKAEKRVHKRKPQVAKKESDVLVPDENEAAEEENNVEMENNDNEEEEEEMEDEEIPDINPCQSLFDNTISPTLQENLDYMTQNYSFFLPDTEYLIDLEGLLGYCSEKIRLGRTCLYCQKMFTSYEGCMKHMRDKRHCKILYERGVDQDEFDVFYDFSPANEEFLLGGRKGKKKGVKKEGAEDVAMEDADGVGEDEEWEDMSDGEEHDTEEDEAEEDDIYAAYQEEIATHGFDITPLGELIFPDGRIVGHRALSRYYKQRFAPDRTERAAVRAAKEAQGDRLYEGRVVNLYHMGYGDLDETTNRRNGTTSTALSSAMGRMAGNAPTGRTGNGILLKSGGSFTALSLYRYRAVVKKARREDSKGQRLQYRTSMNMNKMGKKGNNIATGVIMTHQPR